MKKAFLVAGVSLLLLGAGCLDGGTSASAGGGVYGTTNGGKTWSAMNVLPLSTGVGTISGADILALERDPSNANVIYAGTKTSGLIMSFDSGKSWERPPAEEAFTLVRSGAVLDVEVDPRHPCTYYILKTDRLMKTETCGRSYNVETYKEGRSSESLTALALDWYNPDNVWLGTTAGDVFKSTNAGGSWTTATRLKDDVASIEISNADSRVINVGTNRRSVVRSADAGASWTEKEADFKSFQKGAYVHDFAQTDDGKMLYMSTDYGIFYSTDMGATWVPVKMVTAHGEVKISAIAVAHKNPKVIVYGANATLYRTSDGGESWTTSALPTTRSAATLIFPSDDEGAMLLGVEALTK
jgi:photosystem II stability/assembly factor-like uncharacterized protein